MLTVLVFTALATLTISNMSTILMTLRCYVYVYDNHDVHVSGVHDVHVVYCADGA